MRNIIFLISTFLLSIVYKKAYAITPEECLQGLMDSNRNTPVFGTSKNTYCVYIPNGTIKKGTFRIRRTRIEDWDIKIGKMGGNTLINPEEPEIENVPMKYNKRVYSFTIENSDSNAIVWTLRDRYFGIIEKVEIEMENENGTSTIDLEKEKIKLEEKREKRSSRMLSKPFADFNENIITNNDDNITKNDSILEKRAKEQYKNCFAFSDGKMVWEDISWDKHTDKTISNENSEIIINDSKYMNIIALYFLKAGDDNRGTNNYFDMDFSLKFLIKTDSPKWMVYVGQHDKDTNTVKVFYTWSLESYRNENIEVSNSRTDLHANSGVTEYTKLPYDFKPDTYYRISLEPKKSQEKTIDITSRNNIIWFVNIAEEQEEVYQTISIKDMYVFDCSNGHDTDDKY